jgi:hypothetical protein
LLFLWAYTFNDCYGPFFENRCSPPPGLPKLTQMLLRRHHGLRTCIPGLRSQAQFTRNRNQESHDPVRVMTEKCGHGSRRAQNQGWLLKKASSNSPDRPTDKSQKPSNTKTLGKISFIRGRSQQRSTCRYSILESLAMYCSYLYSVTTCKSDVIFFFWGGGGATAPIWALAYLHETLRFTSVF